MRSFMLPVLLECFLCGYSRRPEVAGRPFEHACACLTRGCDGESGDECEAILLCSECV